MIHCWETLTEPTDTTGSDAAEKHVTRTVSPVTHWLTSAASQHPTLRPPTVMAHRVRFRFIARLFSQNMQSQPCSNVEHFLDWLPQVLRDAQQCHTGIACHLASNIGCRTVGPRLSFISPPVSWPICTFALSWARVWGLSGGSVCHCSSPQKVVIVSAGGRTLGRVLLICGIN